MALIHADRVQQSSASSGRTDFTLGASIVGWQTFLLGVGHLNSCYYCATDGDNWEVGLGTFSSGGSDTLTRTTILASSNGGAKVNFPVAPNIFTVIPSALFMGSIVSSIVAANSQKLNGQLAAYYLDRGNHTDTQLLSTIADAGNLAALNTIPAALVDDQGSGGGLDADTVDGQHADDLKNPAIFNARYVGAGLILTTGGTRFSDLFGLTAGQAIESTALRASVHATSVSKTISNMFVRAYTNAHNGVITCEVLKNGIATGLIVSISAGSTVTNRDVTNSFTCAYTDGLSLRWIAGGTAGDISNVSWGFELK